MKPLIALTGLATCIAYDGGACNVGLTADQAYQRCPQGWTQRARKWTCRDPRKNEIYYSRLPAEYLKDVR